MQRGYGVDYVYMNSDNESDTEVESQGDTENQDLLEIINDNQSTFDSSLPFRKKLRETSRSLHKLQRSQCL